MAPSITEVKSSNAKIGIYLEELATSLEERERLVSVLKLTPSANDNYDLISLLQKLVKYLKYLQDDLNSLIRKGDNVDLYTAQFEESVSRYNSLYDKLSEDSTISVEEYAFEASEFPRSHSVTNGSAFGNGSRNGARDTLPKTVRFQEDIIDDNDNFRNELMGTRAFKPYSDEDPANITDSESFDAQTNQQLFAQHQQTLLEQDENLDVLHESISRSHAMGQTINTELDDHLIILNDLERGVEDAHYRLNTAANRLHEFRNRLRENGSLVTIVVLTVILIMLLVVLN
ncbi:uncharacterized protein RJT20DRAFT_135316 [Scheffersomyces xylosifermentans]|uniref:uncharacterized protein n=1 Tax=Scheffersomyces xylosifermentans TaxID=1304137 RepID=UPI00315C902F